MGRKPMTDAARIRAYFAKHSDAKPADVAKALGVKPANVYVVRSKMKQDKDLDEKWKTVTMNITNQAIEVAQQALAIEIPADPVNHPLHYKSGGIETIDFIEAKGLNYRLGNVVKYITRADHKGDRMEDLKKALWYLQREIEKG